MMNKIILYTILLLIPNISFSQFDITIRGGGLIDMYRLETEIDDGVFTDWKQNIKKGQPWDEPNLNLEITYRFKEIHSIGLRYHFEEYWSRYCRNASKGGIQCYSSNDDSILKISSHYSRKIRVSERLYFSPSVGIGISFAYYDSYYEGRGKIIGYGSGISIEGKDTFSVSSIDYLDNRLVPFIPIELNFNYQFNNFLIFSFNLGYNQYLRKSVTRTELLYTINGSDERKAEVFTGDNMYLGLGISYRFDIKKMKDEN